MFSCSPESAISVEENNASIQNESPFSRISDPDVSKAGDLYLKMISSPAYIDYLSHVNSFAKKLNYNEVTYTNKKEAMEWINKNLSKTLFSKTSEFEVMFDTGVDKLTSIVNSNATLFKLLSNTDKDQFILIVGDPKSTIPGGYPNATNSCIDSCIDSAEAAFAAEDKAYRDKEYDTAINGNGIGKIIEKWINDSRHEDNNLNIALQFNNCAGGC